MKQETVVYVFFSLCLGLLAGFIFGNNPDPNGFTVQCRQSEPFAVEWAYYEHGWIAFRQKNSKPKFVSTTECRVGK